MRKTCLLALAAVLLGAVLPSAAQKVKSQYDKKTDFSHYKKYGWGSNYIMTHQRPDDQARINTAIVDSVNRNLQAKGYVLSQDSPDFTVIYEAGAITQGASSGQPDMLTPGGANWASDSLGGTPVDVWASNLAKLRITVTDSSSKTPVFRTFASQKVAMGDEKKFMNDLKNRVDEFVDKAMKDFPPKK
jgi:hypothetical protein